VINLSSAHGLRASPFKSAYVSAKHGLEGLSKVIALEGAPHGVTSNCVNPAYVRTPLVEKQIADQAAAHGIAPEEVVERIMLAPVAVKRLHDVDYSGYFALALLVPLVNLAFTIWVGILPGKAGPNRFGATPDAPPA
jgi:3-hydroxybutyrate dehydrogenase